VGVKVDLNNKAGFEDCKIVGTRFFENGLSVPRAGEAVCKRSAYQAELVTNSKFDWSLAFPLLGLFAGFRRPDRNDVSGIRAQVEAIHKTAETYKAQVSASAEPEARAYFIMMFWQTEIEAAVLKVNHAVKISQAVKFDVVSKDGSVKPISIDEKSEAYIKEAASRLLASFASVAIFFNEQSEMSSTAPDKNNFSRNHMMLFDALLKSNIFLWGMTGVKEKLENVMLSVGMFGSRLLGTGRVEDVKYVLRLLDSQTWYYSKKGIEASKLTIARTALLPLMKEYVLSQIMQELVKQNLTPQELQKSLNAERRALERFIKKGASPAGEELLTTAGTEVFYKGISLTQFHPVETSPDAAMAALPPPAFRRNFPDVKKGKVATALLANAVKCPEIFLRELRMLREKLELVERTLRRPERK